MEKLVAFTSFLLLLQYYVISSSAMTQSNISTDQLALLSLKSQIISDPFHFLNESWSPAKFACHWVEVTCGSRHQRVRFLNLSNMDLTGVIPRELGNLTFLVSLDLGSNKFHGYLPQEMAHLDLSYNSLEGDIPEGIGEIGRLSNLQMLELGTNHFSGIIPQEIGNLVNLVVLALERNQITVSFQISIFNISSLKILSAWQNNLSGFLPREIGNLTKRQHLQISENKLIGEIPKEISNLVELDVLDLSTDSFSGSLNMEIFNISGLSIDLSLNNLSGKLPPNIGSILPHIERIYMTDLTNLVGTIPHSISNCSKLTRLELSNNKLTGLIPNSFGYLTHLEYLNLGGNNLTSDSLLSFLTSLTNCRNLTTLSLSLNPLNSMLPVSVGNFSMSLIKFYANNCKINGRIPNDFWNLSSLFFFHHSRNYLVRSIPTSIGNLRSLQRFNLSKNKLTGFIGDHICKLQHLGDIYMDQNQLSGSLPNCLGNITSLREIHLGSNKLSSNIPPSLANLQDLVVLDLTSNNMVGSLPKEIGNLKAVTLIDLSMNQFSNEIPTEIGGLQNLAHLPPRYNKLQGSIPDSMSNMELFGEIPWGGLFKNLSSQFFIYNEALCGSSRFSVPPCPTSSKHRSNRKKLLFLFLLLRIALVVVPSTFIFLWIRYRKGKRAPQQADSLSAITSERIAYYELIQATDELSESNLIGSGSFGSVYKVLEYMPNESLEKYLYSHNYFLDTKQRLSIMIDVACALEYLHHGCSLPVIHCDVKPSNVLLDEDMVAHLSDFGIAKLLGEDEGYLYTKTLATLGYIAPEYGLDGLVSTKCDVYSYGVLLLETFTRRKPNEFERDLSLKQWVSYSLPGAVMDVVDSNLVTQMGSRLQMELDVVGSISGIRLLC
ncbi:hypothetical protein P3S67_013612 [Capsicum chacoense]